MKRSLLRIGLVLGLGLVAFNNEAEAGQNVYTVGTWIFSGIGTTGADALGYLYVRPGTVYAAPGGDPSQHNSTIVTDKATLKATTAIINDLVQGRTAEVLETSNMPSGGSTTLQGVSSNTGANKGLSGGSTGQRFGVWARPGWTNIKDGTVGADWNANLYALGGGADYKFNDHFVVGLALSGSYLKGTTNFNKGTMKDYSFGLAPYLGIKLTNWFSVDAMVGYNRANKTRTRQVVNAVTGAIGPVITGKPRSDQYFGILYANLTYQVKKIDLLAKIGYSYSQDKQKAFTETGGAGAQGGQAVPAQSTNVQQALSRIQAGHWFTEKFCPYVFGTYIRELSSTQRNLVNPNDPNIQQAVALGLLPNENIESKRGKDTWGGGLGFHFKASDNLTAGLEGSYAQSKKLKMYNVVGKVRYQF